MILLDYIHVEISLKLVNLWVDVKTGKTRISYAPQFGIRNVDY